LTAEFFPKARLTNWIYYDCGQMLCNILSGLALNLVTLFFDLVLGLISTVDLLLLGSNICAVARFLHSLQLIN
jgi:hypothetical protein